MIQSIAAVAVLGGFAVGGVMAAHAGRAEDGSRLTVDVEAGRARVILPACDGHTSERLVVMEQCAAVAPSDFDAAAASVRAWEPDARPVLAQTEGENVVVYFGWPEGAR